VKRAPALEPGTQLGPYTIRDVLGRGSQGAVYLARREGEEQDQALKVIHPGADRAAVARFEREVVTLEAVDHPEIVRILDHGQAEGGLLYYAMERVEASANLERRILALGPLEPTDAARLLVKLARAVDHAHEQGVIHRDLKPSNILLAGGSIEQPRIADFGLALVAGGGRLTQTGAIVGTPCYLAPEVVRGEKASRRSDVYALGAVFYECLTGRPPFAGPSIGAILSLVLRTTPRPPREARPEIPPALARICLSCLEKHPAHRPATAAAVARSLERALGEGSHDGSLLEDALAGASRLRVGLRRWGPWVLGALLGLEVGFLAALAATVEGLR
jgi:serine/threonine-protein kinase